MRVRHADERFYGDVAGTLIRMLTTWEDSVSIGLVRWDDGREVKEDMDNIVELDDDLEEETS